ncbi:transport system permease [Salinisphaera sp. PC39]|uniref:FecCD family ABC transporter permease n=1 Tax=Salinisphaera sp. PC39 TaxID=1304156 RepID=UPI00333F1209
MSVAAADLFALERRRVRRGAAALAGLGLALTALLLAGLGHGAVAIAPLQSVAILADAVGLPAPAPFEPVQRTVLLSIRLPRVVLGLLAGASLAVAGAALQGLFRNPLADPGLIGVSSGAGLAAAAAIVFGAPAAALLPAALAGFFLPLAAFAGGLAATLVVYRIATRDGRTQVATLLLAGVALNAIANAGLGLLIFMSDEQELRDLNFWLLGSLGGNTWRDLLPVAPFVILPTLLLTLLARPLNALLLGETEAGHLGFAVERLKRGIVVLVALAVGASVALTGIIGFIGLVVPHLVRLALGPDHRLLLPASVLLGAALMLGADLLARTLVLPAELPIGILTSCVGGPFFLWLLVRRRDGGLW